MMPLAIFLLCASGARAEPAVAVSTTAASRLSAAPNPCGVETGKKYCRARLVWKAETSSTTAQLALVMNGGPDRSIACGLEGARDIGWVVPGNSYVFTLYGAAACDPASRGAALASVTVTGRPKGKAAAPTPTPTPHPALAKPRPKPSPKKKRG